MRQTEFTPSHQARSPIYVLGHAEDELQRLIDQSRHFGDLTEQVLVRAGVASGMKVLDLGCGAGDVSFLPARLVGPTGTIIGIDNAPEAVSMARHRAARARLANVTFLHGDITDYVPPHPVDAVVGRLVLMYLADPAVVLRRFAGHVRPGGVVAFHEMDFTHPPVALPVSPTYEQIGKWFMETYRRAGAETQMGLKLYQAFLSAGLPAPQLTMGACIGGGAESTIYELIVQTVHSLLPMMEQLGVAKPAEVEIETLARRLRRDIGADGVITAPTLVGAWTRKPH